jgi:hypothetical protein
MRSHLPISASYDRPIFEALGLQIVLGLLSGMILDGGLVAQFCGIAMVGFWVGAAVLIWRQPLSPSKLDLSLIRVGYLPVVAIAFVVAPGVWHLRDVL